MNLMNIAINVDPINSIYFRIFQMAKKNILVEKQWRRLVIYQYKVDFQFNYFDHFRRHNKIAPPPKYNALANC